MKPRLRARGMALPAAIFLLVIMAALGAFLMRIASLQQAGSAQDILSSRAFQAARAGVEWALYQAQRNGSCSAATGFSPGGNLADFTVSVTVSTTSYTEAGTALRLCAVTATACNQPVAGACPGSAGTRYYVERQLRASFPY